VGSVRQALEAKLGARRLEAEIQACSFSYIYSNFALGFAHCNGNPIYVFLFWKLRGLSPNFYIHVSVRDLYIYIPRIGPYIFLQQNR
jgi:hypothetical protein